jgi:hypothetical protein
MTVSDPWDHQQERGDDFWVLRDPWANEFCVLQVNFDHHRSTPGPELDGAEQSGRYDRYSRTAGHPGRFPFAAVCARR